MLDHKNLLAKLRDANSSREFSRTLKKYHLYNLAVIPQWDNPYSVERRAALLDSQYNRLRVVYRDLGLCSLKYYMKDYQYDADKNLHSFSTGGVLYNYDADLLGGDGYGKVLEEFQKAGMFLD